jgi:uncharacterized protein
VSINVEEKIIDEMALEKYRNELAKRKKNQINENLARSKRAVEIAKKAAFLLKQEYSVDKVVLFGSLVRKETFNRWSDIDIAAWGIKPEDTFKAIGKVLNIDPEWEVNLVDVNTCSESLLRSIMKNGVDLL